MARTSAGALDPPRSRAAQETRCWRQMIAAPPPIADRRDMA
jgi:hypothetical protein